MIRIKKDYTEVPKGLTSETAQHWTERALHEGKNHNANEYVYRHSSVVKSLRRIYADKCGYCESAVGVSSPMFVDHYRPKKGVKRKDDHPGYYWLTYEWSNLISCCGICNNKKLHHFPVSDEKKRIYQPQEDISQWRADSESFHNERPLILHPEINHPEEYLSVDIHGVMKENNSSRRAEITIEVCGLNRDGLVWMRNKIITEVRKRLWETAFSIRQEVRNKKIRNKEEFLGAIKDRFAGDFDSLILKGTPKEEYSLVGKCMLQEFKSFFTDMLPDESTRNILHIAFRLFSEQGTEEVNHAQDQEIPGLFTK